VVALLVNRLSELKIGHALSSDSQIGPLINEAAAERYSKFVDQAKKDGEMHLTGERLDSDQFGSACYVSPTVASIDDVNHSLVQTELFSPFLLVETFVDKDEAIHRANSTTYGLSASVYTKTTKWAQRAARQIKAGTVWINCHNRLMVEAETGGYRTSGLGRLHGVEGLAPFLETKHIYSEFGEW
jgi:acyl-CoA reductase-like NAD-dependent aldehyde dehydrogenase